jgi:hypothetical protein
MTEQLPSQISKLSEYGVAGIVLAIVLIGVFLLIAWLLRQWEKKEIRSIQEAAKWFEVASALKTSIDTNNRVVLEESRRAEEAAQYVRQEHKEMCSSLTTQNESLKLLIQKLELKPCLAERG